MAEPGQSVTFEKSDVSGNSKSTQIGFLKAETVNIGNDEKTPDDYKRGLSLVDAPIISDDLFIGREEDIKKMETHLLSRQDNSTRKVLVVGGMGGIGKTQLVLCYAKRYQQSYSAIFWLNATSQLTLMTSFRRLAPHVLRSHSIDQLNDEQILTQFLLWLSENDNQHWLLLFDNYDEPGQFRLEKYYPIVAHGSIIVTTRQPDQVNGTRMKLDPILNIEDSLKILAARSERPDVLSNDAARQLAERFDGLPLALATAGAFLKQSSASFSKYLQYYESRWRVTQELPDYQMRTLYTTWDVSFAQIENEMPEAAKLLQFLAYLAPQNIWFGLFQVRRDSDLPQWINDIQDDEILFEDIMTTLGRYGLVQSQLKDGSYSLHICVHDWTLNKLNRNLDSYQYWIALDCVYQSLDQKDSVGIFTNKHVVPHAVRLADAHFQSLIDQQELQDDKLDKFEQVGKILRDFTQFQAATQMFDWALQGSETAFGPSSSKALEIIADLGMLYILEENLDKAEQCCKRALNGLEEIHGSNHVATLEPAHGLAQIYQVQGKFNEAEQMCRSALTKSESLLGHDRPMTLRLVENLGLLYLRQDRLDEAEQMNQRALTAYKKIFGPDHSSTATANMSVGIINLKQGKFAEAEQIFQQVLSGSQKVFGPNSLHNVEALYNLGELYYEQRKFDEAREMLQSSLTGWMKLLGPEHIKTLSSTVSLGRVYTCQGKFDEGNQYLVRGLATFEKAYGKEQTLPLQIAKTLGRLYRTRLKIDSLEFLPKTMTSIISLVERSPMFEAEVYMALHRALILAHDEENALRAFFHQYVTTGSIWTSMVCDECGQYRNDKLRRYMCKVCQEIDVCEDCFDQVGSSGSFLPDCGEHEFFKIDFESQMPSFGEADASAESLVQRLRERHGTSKG